MAAAKTTFDLASIGECMVEFTQIPGTDQYRRAAAGDAFNVIAYASRLGLGCRFISAGGHDMFSDFLYESWHAEGVDTVAVPRLEGRQNGVYFIRTGSAGERTFQHYRRDSAATETLTCRDHEALAGVSGSASTLFLSGITLAVLKERERLFDLLRSVPGSVRIAFDTNVRLNLWPDMDEYRQVLERLLPYIDVALPTEDDERRLHPGESRAAWIQRYVDAGCGSVVLKVGAEGALVWEDGRIKAVPTHVVEAVDTTAAGDSFNAGFLAGQQRGMGDSEAARLGNALASLVVQRAGAIVPGVSNDDVMRAFESL